MKSPRHVLAIGISGLLVLTSLQAGCATQCPSNTIELHDCIYLRTVPNITIAVDAAAVPGKPQTKCCGTMRGSQETDGCLMTSNVCVL